MISIPLVFRRFSVRLLSGRATLRVSVLIMLLRMLSLGLKFGLTFFITHYIGLAQLGLYGLVVAASSLLPAVLGFGMNGVVDRHIVDMPLQDALPHMVTRLTFNVLIYVVLIPLAIVMAAARWVPIPPLQMALMGLVVFSEHLAIDVHGQIVARHQIQLANILLFVRGGAWVLPFILLGWRVPAARSLNALFVFWMSSSLLFWGILAVHLTTRRRWRDLHLNWSWLRASIGRGRPFYLSDLGQAGGLYLDRFIISFFLGLEMTGVYTFFWSMTNSVNSLVYYGVIQARAPKMIGARKRSDHVEFAHLAKRLQTEVWGVSLTLGVCLWLVFPRLTEYLHRPLLDANMWAFAVMLMATLTRLGADGLNTVLYAKGLDRSMATVAVAGVCSSALFNLLGAATAGFVGVVWAYVATAILLFILNLSRLWPLAKTFGSKRAHSE